METIKENIKIAKYTSLKHSGVEWLGEIPAHWACVSLGSLLELKSDKGHPEYEVLSVYREYGVIPKDSRDDNHNATSLDTTTYKAVNPGDLVVNKMKAWQGSMGISSHKGIVSPAYITCKITSKDIDTKYLHLLLRCNKYIGEYYRLSYGVRVGQWDMHYEDFKKVDTLIPPPEEQTAIADFLDRKTEQIDRAIAQKEKQIELLKERRQILIHRAVTRGLDPNIPLKNSGVEWIGQMPEHWEVKRLKYCCEVFGRIGFRGYNTSDLVNEGEGAITISPSNITENGMSFIESSYLSWEKYYESPEIQVFDNDILFVKTGSSFGKVDIVKNLPTNATINPQLLVFKKLNIDSSYLSELLKTGIVQVQVNKAVVGSTIPTLSENKVLNIYVPIPTHKNEIEEITKYIGSIKETHFNIISTKLQEIEKLKEYKNVLINEAVTGKIKVV